MPILLEYIEWIRNNKAHKNLEALFHMFFLELQDLYKVKETNPSMFLTVKISKFKEAIALILVKCEYDYIIYYILRRKENSKTSKINLTALRKEAVESSLFKSEAFGRVTRYPLMWELEEFHPFISLDITLLTKCITFAYRYFYKLQKASMCSSREAVLAKIYLFYVMLHEDNLKAYGFERKFVLEKILYLKEQMVTSFSFEELMIAVNYCDQSKEDNKDDAPDLPIDITMKVIEDPEDVEMLNNSLSTIDSKFFRAMAMFQIKDFQSAK